MTLSVQYGRDQERRGLSPGTIERRRRVLRSFRLYRDACVVSATPDEVEAWLDSCRLTARSRYVYLSTLHGFYQWARRHELSDGNDPTEAILRPRLSRLIPRPMQDADLTTAISQADDRMRCWLTLAAFEGFRCKEIAELERQHVLEDRDPPLIAVAHGKGGHQAVLPLNPSTHLALRLYGMPRSGPVFTKGDGRPFLPGTVSTYMARYLHGLGIEATAHRARHWFGTRLWADTKDLRLVQEMMRHASPTTTAGYTAYDQSLAGAAVRALRVESLG